MNFKFETVGQKVENKTEFAEHFSEKKKDLLNSFLEKHSELGHKARELAMILMGITSVFAGETISAQTTQSDFSPKNTIEFLQNKGLESLKISDLDHQLPENTINIFSSKLNTIMMNNKENIEKDNSGHLNDTGESILVTTGIQYNSARELTKTGSNGNKKNQNIYSHYIGNLTVSQMEGNLVEARGDKLQIKAIGNTHEEAIANALEDASQQIRCKVMAKNVHKINDKEINDTSEYKSLDIDVSNIASFNYIYHYEVTSKKYNKDNNNYSVTLEVLPGVLAN